MLSRLFRRHAQAAISSQTPSSFAAVEELEHRQMLAAVPPRAIQSTIDVHNIFENGVNTNTSRISISWSSSVHVGDPSKIGIRGDLIDPITQLPRRITIHVLQVIRSTQSSRSTAIITDRLVPKGAIIVLYPGSFLDAKNNDAELERQTVRTLNGVNAYRFTLASRTFRPNTHSIFSPEIYSNAPAPIDTSAALDSTLVSRRFRSFMNKKLAAGIITQDQFNQSISRFNNSSVAAIIPSPVLRAALLSLVGTIAEPAIGAMLSTDNVTHQPWSTIDFGSISANADLAETSQNAGRLRTIFDTKFRGEVFQALSGKIAHEAVHQDAADGIPEETLANTIETIVWAQQILVDPSWVVAGTTFTQRENTRLLAVLDSGRAQFPRIGLRQAPNLNDGDGVFFGGNSVSGGPYVSFEDYLRRQYEARSFPNTTTVGNDVLHQMVKNITGLTNNRDFSTALISDIDANQQVITDVNAVKLAGILKLSPSL